MANVLLVDDHDATIRELTTDLREAGHTVTVAQQYGIDLTKTLRETGNKVPIILHSKAPVSGAQIKIAAMAAGANDFIQKGSIAPLLAAIDGQLHGRRR